MRDKKENEHKLLLSNEVNRGLRGSGRQTDVSCSCDLFPNLSELTATSSTPNILSSVLGQNLSQPGILLILPG